MKKQFFRVKVLADQTFSKGEKTVPEDLSTAERRVEQIKLTCQSLSKKIQACLQGQGPTDGIGKEKRLKKIPESQLHYACNDTVGHVDNDSLFSTVLKVFGNSQRDVGDCILNFELGVEKDVLSKLNDILETDIPNVTKHRKHLAKLTLDLDSAKARRSAALKSNNQSEKVEVIQEEVDDALQKVEQCRDALAADLFTLMARESEVCDWLMKFVHAQAEYHRRALDLLENVLPIMNGDITRHHPKPVYGCELEEHLRSTGQLIAYPLEACVQYLNEYALKEEGLFRVAGSASKLRRLKAAFDAGMIGKLDSCSYSYDTHTVAGALKSYLRELPTPLLTFKFYEDWMQAAKHADIDVRHEAILKVVHTLPKAYFDNLRYFIKFLSKLSSYHETNKMSSQNLAIVMALNLIWARDEPSDNMLGMNRLTGAHTLIVEMLISHADEFFPGGEEFGRNSRGSNEFPRNLDLRTPDVVPQTNGEADFVPPSPSSVTSFASAEVTNNSPPKSSSPKTVRRPKKPAPPAPFAMQTPAQVTKDKETVPGNDTRHISNVSRIMMTAVVPGSGRPPPVPDKPRHEVTGGKDFFMTHRRAPSHPIVPDKPANAPLKSAPPAIATLSPFSAPGEDTKMQPGHRRLGSSPTQEFPQLEKTHVQMANIEKSQVTIFNVPVTSPSQDHPSPTHPQIETTECPTETETSREDEVASDATATEEVQVAVTPEKPPERPPRPATTESHTSFLQRVRSFNQDVDRTRPHSTSQFPNPHLVSPTNPWQTHSLDRSGRISLPDSSEPPERPLKPDRLRSALMSTSGGEEERKERPPLPPQPTVMQAAARRPSSPDGPVSTLEGDATTGACKTSSSPVAPMRPPKPLPVNQPQPPPVPKPRSVHASTEDTYL